VAAQPDQVAHEDRTRSARLEAGKQCLRARVGLAGEQQLARVSVRHDA
jgi:hypothetical protein